MLRLAAALVLSAALAQAAPRITPPGEFFGFPLGSDRNIARWDRIVEYFRVLEKEGGGRLKVVDMGPSTEGHPFLLVIVSSAANMAKLERLRQVSVALADPRGKSESEIRALVGEGRAVVCQTMSLHASEIGGTQMAPELAYDLLARGDEETRRILDNTILLLIPCFNPDGAIMIADWYAKTRGTEYEGAPLPWLYHKYAGHDNNRDAFQLNLAESRYVAKIMFRDWAPQAYVDHHHMGSYGARLYIPPYTEPIRPHADPLVWREMSWYGAHMAYKEEEAGHAGVINMAQYSGWGHFGFHWITPFHNIAGMLTESADVRLASPIYIHPDQLRGGVRSMPEYEEQTTFPNPWPGGWWRLRDIIDRQKVSAWALMDLAARNRETVLWNAYLKARRQTERGASGSPAAYFIPRAQHDPLTAVKMVNKLLLQGIEIRRRADGFYVPLAQPKMGLIRYLLGRTRYPDNEWTRARDGSPIGPYDMATDTMFEFMGVRVDPLEEMPEGLAKVEAEIATRGAVKGSAQAYVLDGRLNDSFLAVNRLLDRGARVSRVEKSGAGLRAGDFVISGADPEWLRAAATESGVDFLPAPAGAALKQVRRQRIGMYQRYRSGNIDEGWTRFLFEQFGFPYTTLRDAEIKKGGLREQYDLIVLPEDSSAVITGERDPGGRRDEDIPPEYRSGIGKEGVEALVEFVRKGGTLVAFGGASGFAIEKLGLPLRNAAAGRSTKEFWCPGSTLRVVYDNSQPLAWGMPAQGLAIYRQGNPAFEILPGGHSERYQVAARYADRDLLESGWLIDEKTLAKKAAVVEAQVGDGRAILYGFRPQHRAQTHGTFKLVFNALIR